MKRSHEDDEGLTNDSENEWNKRRRIHALPNTGAGVPAGFQSTPVVPETTTDLGREFLTEWTRNLELMPSIIEESGSLLAVMIAFAIRQQHPMPPEILNQWAAASIWAMSKIEKFKGEGMQLTMSRFVESGNLRSLGGAPIGMLSMGPLFETFETFTKAIETQITPYSEKMMHEIQQWRKCHSAISTMFTVYHDLFRIFMYRGVDESITDDDPVERFGWLLFLIGADQHFSEGEGQKGWESSDVQTWCIYCVLFVGVQLSAARRRKMVQVLAFLWGNVSLEEADLRLRELQIDPASDWVAHFPSLRQWLCEKFNIEMTRFRQFETSSMAQLIQTLRETPPGPKFQYQDHPIMVNAECPWHLYQGALDVDSMLYSNLEDMGRHFDLILLQKDYEFDPRLLRPVNKPFATPKRFCRTPRMSTTKSTVSRNLRASLERANVFNTAMHATPIMARSASNASFTRTPGGSRGGPQLAEFQQRFLQFMSTEPARQQALSASLTIPQAVLATLRHHVNGLCERMAEKLRRKCPNPAGDRWRDTMTLYYHIMLEITGSYLQRTKDFQILNDKPFIRSLVFIVFEIVRFTWKLGTKGMTDELLRQINPDCISLIAMLDIVNSTAFWFSDWVRKRLVELQERMMETQVWREPVFYRMLSVLAGASAYAHAHQSGDYGPLIPILTLYQHHCGAGSLEPMGSNPEMAGISGIVGRTQSMIQGRLKQLCDDLRTPESTYSTALKLVQWGLEREHEHRYLNNRHVDVYAICCLYGAAVVQKRPMKFKTIVEMYRRQPQFLDKTLTEIYLGPSETGDLTVYYNTVFLSTMRGFMSLSEGDTGIPGNNYALHALTQPAHINSSAHVAVDIHPVRMPQPPAPSTPTSAAATAHFIPSTPRTPTRTAQLRAAAMDMTPRTRRYSATETPLTPRNMSPGTPNGSSRRLFGGAVGGMAGLPPRIPSARKPSRSDKHQQ